MTYFLTKKLVDRKYIEHYKFKIARIEYDESSNKLTTFRLIAYNDKMSTIMTK